MKKNCNIRDLTRRILSIGLYIFDSFVLVFTRVGYKDTNKSAIVRLDNIGDWVLFQNMIPLYEEFLSPNKVDVFVNKACSSLVVNKENITYTFIDIKKFQLNIIYRFKIIKKISSLSYRQVINPTYSRNIRTSDSICRFANSLKKICVMGDRSNSSGFELDLSKRWYSDKINVPFGHELNINNDIMSSITGISKQTRLQSLEKFAEYTKVPKVDYVVFFIGTSQKGKTWPISEFVNVANHIINTTNLSIVLCGSNAEKKMASFFVNSMIVENRVMNLVSVTSLKNLVYVISNAKFVVTGDTVATHIAANLNKSQVCISGLGQPERFVPYPEKYSVGEFVLINDKCKYSGCNWVCHFSSYGTFNCVSNISSKTVINAVDKLLDRLIH